MASLLYNTEADAIKAIMSGWAAPKGITLTLPHMFAYLTLWYFFTCTTYGCYVPAGTFLPAIIIGVSVGTIYKDIFSYLFDEDQIRDEEYFDRAVVPVLVAVGGMLSAQFRLTYSLTVIMLETTNSINIFAPMMLCALTATKVANFLTPGFYQVAIKQKGI